MQQEKGLELIFSFRLGSWTGFPPWILKAEISWERLKQKNAASQSWIPSMLNLRGWVLSNLNSAPIQNWPDLLRSHRNMINTLVLWDCGQGQPSFSMDACVTKPTFRKGFSFVSMMNLYLHSSQHRVSELLIHCCRQAWCTKWRLPVQWQGVIKGLSSSPSQWHILNQKQSCSLEEEAERMWKRHVISVITHGCPLRILRHTYQRNVFHKGARTRKLPCCASTHIHAK